jgi:MtN3 and saliva related transmembrane protein
MGKDLIGWTSSVLLLLTLMKQVHKQWETGTSKGVSQWLYLGQIAASTGFTAYSALVGNVVFIVTNALGLVSAIAGYVIFTRNRRRDRERPA